MAETLISATPEAIVNYLLTCDLRTLVTIQHLLALQGIELNIGTGEMITLPPDSQGN
jgi:hypothetical protein